MHKNMFDDFSLVSVNKSGPTGHHTSTLLEPTLRDRREAVNNN